MKKTNKWLSAVALMTAGLIAGGMIAFFETEEARAATTRTAWYLRDRAVDCFNPAASSTKFAKVLHDNTTDTEAFGTPDYITWQDSHFTCGTDNFKGDNLALHFGVVVAQDESVHGTMMWHNATGTDEPLDGEEATLGTGWSGSKWDACWLARIDGGTNDDKLYFLQSEGGIGKVCGFTASYE